MSSRYLAIYESLDDNKAYSKSCLASVAMDAGAFIDKPDPKKARDTFRKNLTQLARNNGMPEEQDESVRIPGQMPLPAWYGWRWKACAGVPGYESPQD